MNNNQSNDINVKDSILLSIKKLLMIDPSYEVYDDDIIMHINTTLSILTQMGVGKDGGLTISDANNTWDEFIDLSKNDFNTVKSYVYLKVKLMFDPPQNSALIESINNQIKEFEYRLYTCAGGY